MAKPGGRRLQFCRPSFQVHLRTGGKSGFLSRGYLLTLLCLFKCIWFVANCYFLLRHAQIAEFVCVGCILLDSFRSLRLFWNDELILWLMESSKNKLEWSAGATCSFDGPEAQSNQLRFQVFSSEPTSDLPLFNWLVAWLLQTYRAFASPAAPLTKVGSVMITTQIWSPLTEQAHTESSPMLIRTFWVNILLAHVIAVSLDNPLTLVLMVVSGPPAPDYLKSLWRHLIRRV